MMTTRTRTKSAGVEFPHAESHCNQRSKAAWSSPSQSGSKYYAGAKFDTIPSLSDLPAPPRHWTDSAARSQSTPSSPVTIATKPSAGISLDIGSLFGTPPSTCDKKGGEKRAQGVTKSASLPPQSGMIYLANKKKQGPLKPEASPAVFKTPAPLKARPTVKALTKPAKKAAAETPVKGVRSPVTPNKPIPAFVPSDGMKTPEKKAEPTNGVTGLDLMEMLIRSSPTNRQDLNSTPAPAVKKASSVNLSPCHVQLGSMEDQYKDISEHLKSLLKVSA